MKVLLSLFSLLFSTGMLLAQPDLENWQHLSPKDGVNGIGADQAYKKLANKKSRTVVVAVIDSGVEVDHEDLDDVMWINRDEIAGNGKDDDNNGYIDDIHGWNFIGNKNGENVNADTYEVTRLYAKLHKKFDGVDKASLKKKELKEYALYEEVKEVVEEKRATATKKLADSAQPNPEFEMFMDFLNKLEAEMKNQDVKPEQLADLDLTERPDLEMAKTTVLGVFEQIGNPVSIDELKEMLTQQMGGDARSNRYTKQLDYAYNPNFNSREIVGDNYADSYEKGYGNNDYEGPDAFHGTHVSGIIGAERDNMLGMRGIADDVQIMTLRAVPDGDEHDKDVANAIIYAVDNGAEVINMSFGKGYSWDKEAVDAAVKYATKNDVLLVHAAGNASQMNDSYNNFPNDRKAKKGLFGAKKLQKNWFEVGALSFEQGENSAARFSNYSKDQVDIFAPGVNIYSTVPDNGYGSASGTSMASPVVAGMAALLRSYFPELSAAQVKEIMMASSTVSNELIIKPGTDEKVKISELARSGMLNAVAAIELAKKTKGKRKKSIAWSGKEKVLKTGSAKT